MKVHDYETQKIINKILYDFNFIAAYSYLELLAHPDRPDGDIEDLKSEASNLLYITVKEAAEKNGKACVNYSSNFKATFLPDGELHLDMTLTWEAAHFDTEKIMSI